MRERKTHLYVDSREKTLLLHSLVELKNQLIQQGKKVLLIDADVQANLTMSLGYHRPDDLLVTLSTIMQDIIDDKSVDVSQSILHHGEGVDMLPYNIELSVMRSRGVSVSIILQKLAQLKELLEKQWESIVGNCYALFFVRGERPSWILSTTS